MSKKILSLILAALLAASSFALASCAQKQQGGEEGETTAAEGETAGSGEIVEYYDFDLTPYVTLGQYKGLEYTPGTTEITDDDVDAKIDSVIQSNITMVEVTDRPAQNGDTLNIDYVGRIGGIPFEGGTANGQSIVLGNNSYIPGFGDGLLGTKAGDTVVLALTFPEDYHNADYAGRDSEFTVTVNKIEIENVPEFTDEFVQSISETCKTTEEYRAEVRAELQQTADDNEKELKLAALMDQVVENSEVIDYPQVELDRYIGQMNDYYNDYAEYYSMTLEDFCANYMGLTIDEYNEQCQDFAKDAVGRELVVYAIIHAENITLTDEEYAERVAQYAEDYGTDVETFEASYDISMIRQSFLMDKAYELVADSAVIVEASAETEADTAETAETAEIEENEEAAD